MKQPVYLDYAATTPVDPRVAEKMSECLTRTGNFGNAASRSHIYGWRAEEAVELAREQVAQLIGAEAREIVWTSGATEADNLAIKGIVEHSDAASKHVITSQLEHKAVLDVCGYLERQGVEVTYLSPNAEGLIEVSDVEQAMRDDTVLVSIMHVNNEIGVINDIASIGALCRSRNICFHVDAAQSAGKVAVDVVSMQVDLMSLSAHKAYGPKGIGALYVRRNPPVALQAQILGGGHERGMRSGTLPVHQIVGMGEAFALARQELATEHERLQKLRDKFWQGLSTLEAVTINGSVTQRVAGNLNVSFAGVDGESLLIALKDVAVSSGSACMSATVEPSYVLKALGLSDELAHSSIRFSFGRFTTEQEIEQAVEHIVLTVNKLRELSPQWRVFKEKQAAGH